MSLAIGGLILVATGTVYLGAKLSTGKTVLEIEPEEMKQTEVNSTTALSIPIISSVFLMLLFFFFQYLQYFMIAMIVFVGALSTFQLFKFAIQNYFTNVSSTTTMNISGILTFMGVTYWLITGNLIVHNVLGCALSITFISTIRFPSLKVAFLLMMMLLAYDIFWVFYSEYFFHKNVMVEVATKIATNPIHDVGQQLGISALQAAKSTIDLPIKLMFWSAEHGRHIMLGLGDIALPGALVAFALRCDEEFAYYLQSIQSSNHRDLERGGDESDHLLEEKSDDSDGSMVIVKKSSAPFSTPMSVTYTLFYSCMVGYFIGMIAAFLCNLYFRHAQPALIYLVPGVLIPLSFNAWRMGRFNAIWTGMIQRDASE